MASSQLSPPEPTAASGKRNSATTITRPHPKMERAIRLYMMGRAETGTPMSFRKVADIIGVGPKTVRRWVQVHPFGRKMVKELEEEVLGEARLHLVRAARKHIRNLEHLSTTATKKTGPRVTATTELLDRAGITSVKRTEVSGPGGGPMTMVGVITAAYARRNQPTPPPSTVDAEFTATDDETDDENAD